MDILEYFLTIRHHLKSLYCSRMLKKEIGITLYRYIMNCKIEAIKEDLSDVVKVLKDNGCDFVISYGGGSPHDCAKDIA